MWTPQPKQSLFMSRDEYEALYGGAAGGGKSDALLVEALRQVHIPHYRAIIFRKTFPQLTDLIDRSYEIYKAAYPSARYNSTGHYWRFKSGAKIYFGNMNTKKDRTKYQGKHFDYIAFDELTHFTWDEYSYMLSRNRPNGPGTRCYMRASANPGGIGHGWVMDRFITVAPPYTRYVGEYKVTAPDGKVITVRRSRVFIPATVFDNKILLRNDPDYIAKLAMMPEAEQRALLYGDWTSFAGQVFLEWRNDPAHYKDQMLTHVIDEFVIPKSWPVYRGFDFGYSRPFSVGWYTVDHDGRLYRIAEYYGCTGTPNEGVQMHAGQIAANIRRIEAEDENLKGRNIIGIADPSIFDESRGESIASIMARPPNAVYWREADNTRLAGKMQMHYRMAFDESLRPMFYVFKTCRHFIRTIPTLVYDEKRVEDIDTRQEDHIYDETRYVMMNSPIAPRKDVLRSVTPYDPLGILEDQRRLKEGASGDKLTFFRL